MLTFASQASKVETLPRSPPLKLAANSKYYRLAAQCGADVAPEQVEGNLLLPVDAIRRDVQEVFATSP